MSNGRVGFVAAQFLTISELKSGPSKTGDGTVYVNSYSGFWNWA